MPPREAIVTAAPSCPVYRIEPLATLSVILWSAALTHSLLQVVGAARCFDRSVFATATGTLLAALPGGIAQGPLGDESVLVLVQLPTASG